MSEQTDKCPHCGAKGLFTNIYGIKRYDCGSDYITSKQSDVCREREDHNKTRILNEVFCVNRDEVKCLVDLLNGKERKLAEKNNEVARLREELASISVTTPSTPITKIPKTPWLVSKQYDMTFVLSQNNEIVIGANTTDKLGTTTIQYIVDSVNGRDQLERELAEKTNEVARLQAETDRLYIVAQEASESAQRKSNEVERLKKQRNDLLVELKACMGECARLRDILDELFKTTDPCCADRCNCSWRLLQKEYAELNTTKTEIK